MRPLSKMILGLVFSFPLMALGHARLIDPAPRNAGSGIKTGPCGNIARTNNPRVLVAGSQLTVRWEETINHPGRYYISFSPSGDQGFEQNRLATVVDTQNMPIGVGPNHQYSTVITVPNTPCTNCTLQMIQSMEENPQAPTFYYSCADIQIVSQGTPTAVDPLPNVTQSAPLTESQSTKVGGGGCGSIQASGSGPTGGASPMTLAFPLIAYLFLLGIARRQGVKSNLY